MSPFAGGTCDTGNILFPFRNGVSWQGHRQRPAKNWYNQSHALRRLWLYQFF